MADELIAVFGEWGGYESTRLTGSGLVGLAGADILLEHIGILSGGTAGIVTIYEGESAVAANKRGGATGYANCWAWEKGLHMRLDGCYLALDGNVTEVCVVFLKK